MSKIKFIKNMDFNKNGNFFDNHPNPDHFYEDSYLLINPTLHKEDSLGKIKTVKEVIRYLTSEYGLCPTRIIDIGSGSTLVLKKIIEFVRSLGFKDVMGLAVDISASILKMSPSYQNIHKLRADASSLPLKSHSFVLLLMIDLLEHIKTHRK